jgi:exopolysaccharide biosynthesis protein
VRLPLALSLAAAGLVPLTAGTASAATSCAPTPGLLSRSPIVARAMPGGGTMHVWDTGPTSDPYDSIRLVAIRYKSGAAIRQRVATTPTVTQAAPPSAYAKNYGRAVVTINGGFFDAGRGALPVGPQLKDGHLYKATSSPTAVVATLTNGHSAYSTLAVAGSVASSGRSWKVVGLNHQSVSSYGVSVYTPGWGPQSRPLGYVDVVVQNGKVVAKRTGSYRGKPVAAGTVVLTANGTPGSQLSALPVGAAVSMSWHPVLGRSDIRSAIGSGGRRIYNGTVWPECDARSEELRPRSAIGWTQAGDLIVMTVSGRASNNGTRWGGATAHQVGDYMKKLGAYEAISLDGGTSTTMVVRYAVSGTVYRVDRSASDYERPVPNVIEIEPTA